MRYLCAGNFALEPEALKQESNLIERSSRKDQNSLIENAASFDHGPDWRTTWRAQVDDLARTGNAIGHLELLAGGNKG